MKNQKNVNQFRAVLGSGIAVSVDHEFSIAENVEKLWLESDFQAARNEVAWNRKRFFIQHVQVLNKKAADKNVVIKSIRNAEGKKSYQGVKMSVEAQDEDVLFRNGFIEVADKAVGFITANGAIVARKVDNYSDTLLSIEFPSGNRENLDNALKYGHIVRLSSVDSVGYYVMTDDGSYAMIYDHEQKPVLSISKIKELIAQNSDVKIDVYWTFINNPSRQRQSSCLFIKGEAGANGLLDRKAHETRMEKIIDSITGGAYSIMKAAYGDKEINFSKLYKIFSRFSLPMTGSSACGDIESIAWYHGDININGIPFADGTGFINLNVFKDVWIDELADHNVCGNLNQSRVYEIKGCHNTVAPLVMARVILAVSKLMNAEIVFIDKNQSVQYWAEMQLGLHKNKIVVIGAKRLEDVSFFGDDTTIKVAADFSRQGKLNVMSVPKPFSGKVKLSQQLVSCFLKVPEAHDVLWEIGKKEIYKIFTKRRSVDFGAIKDVLFPDNTLVALGSTDKNVGRAWLDSAIKTANKTINGFSFKVEGLYGLVTPDFGLFFGHKILKDDEIFVNDRRFWGKRGVCIRYPHNDSGEHVKVRIVGLPEVKERLENLLAEGAIDTDTYWTLLPFYSNVKGGVIVVQSSNKRFAALLGGMDYDGDGITVVTEERVVKLFDSVKSCAIDFGSPAPNPATAKFSVWFLNDGYRAMINNTNDNIGTITNRNMSFMSFESICENLADEDMNCLIDAINKEKSVEEYAGFNEVYESRFSGKESITIDAAAVEEWDKYIKFCGISNKANLLAILSDAQKINSSVAGRTIDSAKTGEIVLAPLAGLFGIIKGGIIAKIKVGTKIVKQNNLDKGTTEVFAEKINTGFQTNKLGKPVFIANDVICKLKNEFADYAAECISRFI